MLIDTHLFYITFTPFYRPSQRRGKKRKSDDLNQTPTNQLASNIGSLIDVVKTRSVVPEPDDCEKYLSYLGSKLRKVPEEKRFGLEKKILNLVEDELTETD